MPWVDVHDDDDRDEFFGLSQDFQMLSTHKRDSGDDNDDVSYEEVGDQHWRAGLGQQVKTFYIGSKCVTRLDTLFIVVCLGNIPEYTCQSPSSSFSSPLHLQ